MLARLLPAILLPLNWISVATSLYSCHIPCENFMYCICSPEVSGHFRLPISNWYTSRKFSPTPWPCLLPVITNQSFLVATMCSKREQKPHKKFRRKSGKEAEFEEIKAVVQSAPYEGKQKSKRSVAPTPLEREAEALVVSPKVSLRDRADAMNALLDLLEQKGISTAYAFEFIRYSGHLINDLITEAKVTIANDHESEQLNDIGSINVEVKQNESLVDGHEIFLKFGRKTGAGLEDSELQNRVYACAEKRGLARFVAYFQILNMKASDIPKVIPFVGKTIDAVMAKVEFLRSVGVRSHHLPSVLASWPELLCLEIHNMASVVEYLQSTGLSRKEILDIFVRHPNVLGQNVELVLKRTVQFLQHIGSSSTDIRKLLIRHPILLLQDVDKKLRLLVDYLESAGIQRKHIGPLLVRRKFLIDSEMEKDILPVIEYLKSLNATGDDIDKIVTSFPSLLRYDLEKDFKPAVTQLERVGVNPYLMGKIFRRYPQLLKNRMKFDLKVQFLLDLGFKKEDLGHAIYNAPQLLGLRVEKLKYNVKFLESLGVKGPSLHKVLKLKPMVLAYSVDGKLRRNVKFLKSVGLNDREVGRLVTRYPQLITLSVSNKLQPTFRYFIDLGFTREEIVKMLKRLPSVLSFSISNVLDPKYKFLTDVMDRSPKELVQFPQYFSYSLDRRIRPRFFSLGENHIYYSLSAIYCCNHVAFEKRLTCLNSSKNKSSSC